MLMLAVAMAGSVMAADVRHDERLERAAADIVAERMGTLRGGLEFGFRAHSIDQPRAPRHPTERRPGVWQDGLAIAIEKKSAASPEL